MLTLSYERFRKGFSFRLPEMLHEIHPLCVCGTTKFNRINIYIYTIHTYKYILNTEIKNMIVQ